ncbi:antibiotic biosynthesis monooxygenase [Cerasicoccus arenae]|uniref:Membrane protein n=1 Tax=Cerasicoccus arenae TaxID=424488 RepID=A0A8J3DE81_9BACT|nr:antibiotic biosynthesis monooxygenase [Cerasicoccus arenae]MBK1859456.1 antibiotic biosynthesis monooxygenase [Cerasicoccus arenae]GHC13664.1 membrane protein [Cerasicoccus arenae]
MPEPVTIFISRTAKPGMETALEAWMREIGEVVQTFPGFVNSHWLESEDGNAPGEFEVVFTFDSSENFSNWCQSPEKTSLYDRLEPMVAEQKIRKVTGLEPWLNLDSGALAPPPKWKMCVLAFLGVYPTLNLVFFFMMPLVHDLPTWLRILYTAPVISILMTFIVMPALSILCHNWLFPEKR